MFWKILVLCASLETGFLSGGLYNYSTPNKDWIDVGTLYTKIEAVAKYKIFYLGGSIDCYFTPVSVTNYYPFQNTYKFNAGLDFGRLSINYEHSCFHPMQPYSTIFDYELKPKYEGFQDKFFVRIQTK